MVKRLFLIRHGKAEWNSESGMDFDRALHQRGRLNVIEMAEKIADTPFSPDLIVSSPAQRAFSTAQYFAKFWNMMEQNIQIRSQIYEAKVKTLLNLVNQFENQYQTIAMFGHNPGFTDLANYLCKDYIYNIPTSGVVLYEFPFEEWKFISADTAKLLLFNYPAHEDD